MRDYVFYPLSLSKPFGTLSKKSRKILGQFIGKKLPTFLAMFIVYLLVGIWHGPEWRYIAYGIWNGIIIVTSILLENSYRKWIAFFRIKEESFCWRVFKMFRTFILCTIGRFFSRAGGFKAAAAMFVSVFHGIRDLSWITNGSLIDLGLSNANWILLLLSIIVLFVVGIFHERGMHIRERIAQQNLVFRWMIYIFAIGAVVVFGVWGPGYDSAAFIYEQF